MKKRRALHAMPLIRAVVRLLAASLILGPLLMWLLVRLDRLEAASLRIGPPLAVLGIALLCAERFVLWKPGGKP